MAYGYQRQPRAFIGDTTRLVAYLYSDDGETLVPQADIASVTFTVMKPSDDPSTPTVDAEDGTLVGDGEAIYVVASAVNDEEGNYKGRAIFTYSDGTSDLVRSVPVEYEVTDPFEAAGVTVVDPVIDETWTKIEDLFDSEQGGPWLRDMTMAHFDKEKLRKFIPDTLMELNAIMPQTEYTQADFPYNRWDGSSVLAQGLLVSTIRHLMRSYTEQPTPTNSPVAYHSREDYQQRWSVIYQVEKERWDKLVALFKARTYNQGRASVLVSSKAGRMLPGHFRSRNIGRGYY